jgi:hypothetical protein
MGHSFCALLVKILSYSERVMQDPHPTQTLFFAANILLQPGRRGTNPLLRNYFARYISLFELVCEAFMDHSCLYVQL